MKTVSPWQNNVMRERSVAMPPREGLYGVRVSLVNRDASAYIRARSPAMPSPISPPTKRPMVNWYDFRQLLSTGVEVLISAAMGQRFDYRVMEDIALPQPLFDYSVDEAKQPRSELWFDFVA